MRRPVYPCSFVSHSHAPCPINGFYQQSGAPAALRRAPRSVFCDLRFLLSVFGPYLARICPVCRSFLPFASLKGFSVSRRVSPLTRPKCVLDSAPACAAYCNLFAHYRPSCAVPHPSRIHPAWQASAPRVPVFCPLNAVLRAIPQIFFTSFTAPLPRPPRGIFFRRVSAPRVPVLLVTFYPLVRL